MNTESGSANSVPDREYAELDQLDELVQFSKGINRYIYALMDLVKSELIFAIQTFPKLALTGLLLLPALLLTWLSFSALIYWLVYSLTSQVMNGLLALFLLQMMTLLSCIKLNQIYLKRLTFPNTRKQLSQLRSELLKNELKTDSIKK